MEREERVERGDSGEGRQDRRERQRGEEWRRLEKSGRVEMSIQGNNSRGVDWKEEREEREERREERSGECKGVEKSRVRREDTPVAGWCFCVFLLL